MNTKKQTSYKATQWTAYIDGEEHIIQIRDEDKLYVDGEYLDKINTRCNMNYEYKFKIGNMDLSIVKFVTDKEYDLVVDGKYINRKREYLPLSAPLTVPMYVLLVLQLISLLAFVFLIKKTDSTSMMYGAFPILGTNYVAMICVKALANCPCRIKNVMLNKLFRLFLMIAVEAVYFCVFLIFV